MVVVWTANQYCAYNSDGTGTSNTQNINAPGTYDYSFDYINVTVNAGTHCASKTKSTGWHAYNTTCTWTASTGYAFDYTGTQTKSKNFTTPGGTYGGDINAKFVKFEITYTNCTATEDSQPNSYYELGLSSPSYFYVDARANTGWSFGGSNTQDLYSDFYGNAIPYPTAPFSATISPDYFYLTFSGTNCKPVKQGTNIVLTSGLYDTAQTFMWVADTNYAFTNSGGTAYPGGNYISTSASPNTYSQTAGYGKYTVSKTNCTANVSTG